MSGKAVRETMGFVAVVARLARRKVASHPTSIDTGRTLPSEEIGQGEHEER